jgi:hypothetical protein
MLSRRFSCLKCVFYARFVGVTFSRFCNPRGLPESLKEGVFEGNYAKRSAKKRSAKKRLAKSG